MQLRVVQDLYLIHFSCLCAIGITFGADQPVYFDRVDHGVFHGGKVWVREANPVHRAAFGLNSELGLHSQPWQVQTILNNGSTLNRIDLVVIGDGFADQDQSAYASQVDAMISGFLNEEPLASYLPYFNVHRVDVISPESGVDEPDLGIFRSTALDMGFNCLGIDYLLCINLSKAVAAAALAPAADQILAMANSERYGGAGFPDSNLCALTGANSASVELGLHEFGHSFARLADEYDYANGAVYAGPEPDESNISIFSAAMQAGLQTKWFRWLDLDSVDAFEGAQYYQRGIYRPTWNSKMRALGQPFGEINVEQFIITMYQTVSPIDGATPPSLDALPPDTEFYVVPMQPIDHALNIQWSVNHMIAQDNGERFTPDPATLPVGEHAISVQVQDQTPRVRDEELRAAWMTESREWKVEQPCRGCGDLGGLDSVDLFDFAVLATCFGKSIPDALCSVLLLDCCNLSPETIIGSQDFDLFADQLLGPGVAIECDQQ